MDILKLIGIIIGTHLVYSLWRALFFSRSEVFGEEWGDNLFERLFKRVSLWLLIFAGFCWFAFGDTTSFVNEINRDSKNANQEYSSSNATTSPNKSSVPQQQKEKSYDASSFEKELEGLK